MNNPNICNNRNCFANNLSKEIKQNPSAVYCFLGKHGVGKEFVLRNIEKQLDKEFDCYQIIADSIYRKKFNPANGNFSLGVSFQLTGLIGISLSVDSNDSSKINYVLSSLKRITRRKQILISAINYDCISSEGREFISILINNHEFIENKIKKKITIIITSTKDYFFEFHNVVYVHFKDYSKLDLYNYLRYGLSCSTKHLTNRNMDRIFRLCGTNFDLVNSYYKYIFNSGETLSLNAIVDRKLQYYISSGRKYNLSKENLQAVLYTAADSIEDFTPHMIEQVNASMDINDVERSLYCAEEEYFLDKTYHENRREFESYLFISKEEKAYLCRTAILNHERTVIKYYVYLSTYSEDEYLLRAQYLYQYFKELNKEVLALIVLALSKAYMFGDTIALKSIKDFFYSIYINENARNVFESLNNAYAQHYCKNYSLSSNIIKSIPLVGISPVTLAEIRRLEFKNGQLGHLFNRNEMNTQMHQLKTYIDSGLYLFTDILFGSRNEKMLEMRILFDIAPYSLDSQNDVETFRVLYDKSVLLEKEIRQTTIKKGYSEYIVNVFKRKAFLFAVPAAAIVHYEQAETFFRENSIFSELAITLSSKAGINLALKRYKEAMNESKEALKIIKDNKIQIRQVEKIYNNLLLAEFLNYEETTSSALDINNFAKETILKLIRLIDQTPTGKNHVILTNIASLSLYIGNFELYGNIKKRIEISLKCTDVSDINDNTINDFYRYHFAWFEFYRLLTTRNWSKCKTLIESLTGFYPAIFHDTKKMELRIKAANHLLDNKQIPIARDYCLHFLEYAQAPQRYFSRGLLLSDLQFTSYD